MNGGVARRMARGERRQAGANWAVPWAGMLLLGLVHLGFVSLGLPDGLLGVAWPSIRQTFGLPLDALGAMLCAGTVGGLVSSLSSGPVVKRLGVGRLLAFSGFATGAALLGYALAPAWWVMVGLAVLLGLGAGAIDAGMNAYVALRHSVRHLHWLHASYGVGATLGPFVMLTVLDAGHPWRWGYAAVAAVQFLLGTAFLLNARQFAGPPAPAPAVVPGAAGSAAAAGRGPAIWRLPAVWCGVALFFVYAAVEASAGQWSYTLFTEGRGLPANDSALWVSIYWGVFTVGRILIGIVANRVSTLTVLRLAMAGILLGAVLLWWHPTPRFGYLGLALIGFAAAPVFSSLVAATPARLGPELAATAIGWQVGASAVGLALGPAAVGVLAERLGLEVVGPFLVVAVLLTLALHETLIRLTQPRTDLSSPD